MPCSPFFTLTLSQSTIQTFTMPHVYGECALNAAVAATNSLLSNGNLNYSALADPTNPETLTFESVSAYKSYARLCQWLLPVAILLTCVCSLFFVDICLFSSYSLRGRISSYRRRSFLRGLLFCSGSVAAVTLLLSQRFTGLETRELLRLNGSPNFYYAAQLTLAQWIFATGLMYVGHSLSVYTDSMCRKMEGLVLALLAFFYFSNLPQDSAGSQTRQVIGVLLLLVASCALASYQQMLCLWCTWGDLHALTTIENLLHNTKHPNYQRNYEQRDGIRQDPKYKENKGRFERAIQAKIYASMSIDLMLILSLALLYESDVSQKFRPALVQVDNPECAGYWPVVLFVVLGFVSIVYSFLKSVYLWSCFTNEYQSASDNWNMVVFVAA